jgi:hypothetical protein
MSIFLHYMLIIFCFIIICMLAFLIFIVITKKPEIHHIYHEKNHTTSEIKKEDELPIYPKKLPQYDNTEYQQIGILTANETDKEPIVLPLFAKRLKNNRDRWQYYTATDKNNMIRLPVVHSNMKCDEDIGCKEIYNGDKLSIEIYQGRTFTATIYKQDVPKYFADVY